VKESCAPAGDGVEVTSCARDFEIHVDLFAATGAESRAEELAAALVAPNERYLFSREEGPTAGLVLDLLATGHRKRLTEALECALSRLDDLSQTAP